MNRSRILIIVFVVVFSFVFVSAVSADNMTYVVRSGDTLWWIARRYGTTLAAIQAANPTITDVDLILVGQVLVIPVNVGTGGQGAYIIQPGDNLYRIALRYGTTVEALQRSNPYITNPHWIYAGNRLTIPGAITVGDSGGQPIVPIPADNVYVVQPGDGLMSIARRYGTTVEELLRLNPHIENRDLILVGDRIKLRDG